MFASTALLIEKIQSLPPARLAEVDDFVEFLRHKEQERADTGLAAHVAAPSFAEVWDNAEDEAYDAL